MPNVLNLDRLYVEPLSVELRAKDGGGKFEMIEQSADNIKAFGEKARASEAHEDVAQSADASTDLLAFLLPDAPRALLGRIDRPYAMAIIRHWTGATREAIAKESADFQVAAADPTSPG